MTIPNMLTLLRMFLIPVLVIAFYTPYHWAEQLSAGIFLLASITDWVDGYLARKLNQASRFGAFLDPVADKLIVCTALILLVADYQQVWFTVPVLVIVCREIMVSALREWMAELGNRSKVQVSVLGKVKTAVQMMAIFVLLLNPTWYGLPWKMIGLVGVYIAAALTLLSMFHYFKVAIDE